MRFKLSILFFFFSLLANAQDTIALNKLIAKCGLQEEDAGDYMVYGFDDPNVYLTNLIYQQGKLFTGIAKVEHVDPPDINGGDATFIVNVEKGTVRKVSAINSSGVFYFRFYTIKNCIMLNDSILARDTVWIMTGAHESKIEYSAVIFEREGRRYFTTEYVEDQFIRLGTGDYEWKNYGYGNHLSYESGYANRTTDTINKKIILDTIVNDHLEYHEYDADGNNKSKVISIDTEKCKYIDYTNWPETDTLSVRWFNKPDFLYDSLQNKYCYQFKIEYVKMKNGTTREWYENGQLKSEQIKNENGEMEIRNWNEKGKLLKKK
jgi:hypothetical protein